MNKLEREQKTSEQRRGSYFNSLNMSAIDSLFNGSQFFKLSTV